MKLRALLLLIMFAGVLPAESRGTIQAYTNRKSYVAGDTIGFHVSTTASTYAIEIVREGLTPQTVASVAGLPGMQQPLPQTNGASPNWAQTYSWVVPANWTTGSYYARFIESPTVTHLHPFCIRNPTPGSISRIAFCMDYNTRNAYNFWGGKSLYVGNPNATRVSFLRPFFAENGLGKGAFLPYRCFGRLEAEGYPVEYQTEWDIDQNPSLLLSYDIVVFSAHVEYNSRAFYDAIIAHHRRGGHLVFFSANDLWWQVRYEDDGQTMVGYKGTAIPDDPMYGVNNELVTTYWRESFMNRPGEALQGISFTNYSGYYFGTNYTVRDADHWIFEGTGLQNGQVFGQDMAAGETDFIGYASPPVVDILLAGKLTQRNNLPGSAPQPFDVAAAIFYEDSPAYGFPNGNGGQVFASGNQGLCTPMMDNLPGNMAARRMFRNLFDHMLASPPPALRSPQSGSPRATAPTSRQPRLSPP